MIEKKIKIVNPSGMHAKASGQFVSFVYKFKSDVFIISGEREANAKSILNLIMLSLSCGDEILLRVSGKDEETAMEEISAFIQNLRD
ncbi:MAG: HPr family phosphocarrier protein [Firmicutes bacterium]|nr:HPr family phosphocarrier protein [Bacillota bacterium]